MAEFADNNAKNATYLSSSTVDIILGFLTKKTSIPIHS